LNQNYSFYINKFSNKEILLEVLIKKGNEVVKK